MSFPTEKPMSVVVVGGSLTGLMHGVVLKRLGHNVRILERNPASLQSQGVGISAMENVQEFLKSHDVANGPYFITSPHIQFINKEAKIINTWNLVIHSTSWSSLYYRLRFNFDGLQSDYVPETYAPPTASEGEATYEQGKTVIDVKYQDGSVTVVFEDKEGNTNTITADLVIAADGPGSSIRKILQPSLQREYVGYLAWRGAVLESDVSEETKKVFDEKLTYFQTKGSHILLYVIPGANGTLTPGSRLLNYVWYMNHSPTDLASVLTDTAGHTHRITLPAGKMRDEIWSRQKAIAADLLPAAYSELVQKTTSPFVQAINDVASARSSFFGLVSGESPLASFFDGKLLFAGDALCAFRPHVARSTDQAALDALLLEKVLKGEISIQEWEARCMGYAKYMSAFSKFLGSRFQFGMSLATFVTGMQFGWVILKQKLSKLWGGRR